MAAGVKTFNSLFGILRKIKRGGLAGVGHFQLPFRDSCLSAATWSSGIMKPFNSLFGILQDKQEPPRGGGTHFQLPFRDSLLTLNTSSAVLLAFQLPFRDSFGRGEWEHSAPELSTPFSGFLNLRWGGNIYRTSPFNSLFGILGRCYYEEGGGDGAFNSLFGILLRAVEERFLELNFQLPFRDSWGEMEKEKHT